MLLIITINAFAFWTICYLLFSLIVGIITMNMEIEGLPWVIIWFLVTVVYVVYLAIKIYHHLPQIKLT